MGGGRGETNKEEEGMDEEGEPSVGTEQEMEKDPKGQLCVLVLFLLP